ncbi:MAG: DPP IV N-terminal domain-containing protein [Desulfatibacillaceae bacterium]|nr:DPP IV N-terminal domain-containing protein [Desulfatibacillaceae bacterium]
MKKIKLFLFLMAPLMLLGCATSKQLTLVGPGHTFRDLRQHTFSSSKDISYFDVNISPDAKLMAFVKEERGNKDIYIKEVNSKAMTQKTFHPGQEIQPAFSPDGTKLAFAANWHGNWDIFVINVEEGKATRQITFSDENEISPSWSKDGKKIAFSRFSRSGWRWEIWTFDFETGAFTNLVPGLYPTFAPTDNILAFQRPNEASKEKYYGIWTITESGIRETMILSSEDEGYINPTWSPDGAKLVFAAGGKEVARAELWTQKEGQLFFEGQILQKRETDIWTINRDGTNLTQLTGHDGPDWNPSWARDGRIYFSSKRDGYYNIWSVIPEFITIKFGQNP